MIFPDGFADRIKAGAIRFKFSEIEALDESICGVYLFIHKANYLYVGKSGGSLGIRERLKGHFTSTHNQRLSTWIRLCNGTLRVACVICNECELDDLERSLIKHLQPQLNKIRYDSYTPLNRIMETS